MIRLNQPATKTASQSLSDRQICLILTLYFSECPVSQIALKSVVTDLYWQTHFSLSMMKLSDYVYKIRCLSDWLA